MTNKEKYISLLTSVPNTDGLVEWLCKTDFFTAPASTKYHGAYEQGLVEHSLNVLSELMASKNAKLFTDESIIKVALLHDICKANTYLRTIKAQKSYETEVVQSAKPYSIKRDDRGLYVWTNKETYEFKDDFPYGHGEKSVLLASRFIDLTEEEIMAIRWHMGAFDEAVKGGFNLSQVFERYPLALELHIADLRASYLVEKR